jgi:hypothetical protein
LAPSGVSGCSDIGIRQQYQIAGFLHWHILF